VKQVFLIVYDQDAGLAEQRVLWVAGYIRTAILAIHFILPRFLLFLPVLIFRSW